MISDQVTKGLERAPHRSLLYALGYTPEELKRPLVAFANSQNEIVPGHLHLDRIAEAAKAGVRMAGGTPIEFHTIAICDGIAMGHQGMKYPLASRELIADSVEAMAKDPRDCPIYSKKIVYIAGVIGNTAPMDPNHRTWRTLYSVGYDVSGQLLKSCWNAWWGYGDPEKPEGTEDIFYEMCYGCYDIQIDHSSPWPVNLPGRKFNVGFTPERFSIGYLQKFGR